MDQMTLKSLLASLADTLDGPDGVGGGAVCLLAIAEIEAIDRYEVPPAEPSPE